jgi:GAF domain-containing protein
LAPDPVLIVSLMAWPKGHAIFSALQVNRCLAKKDARRMPDGNLPDTLRKILVTDIDRRSKAARVTEAIRAAGAYRWVGMYDVDMQRGLVSNVAWSGPAAPTYPTFPVTKGLTSRAIAEKRTVNVGNVANDPGYLTALDSTRSEMIVPVLDATGSVIGTLDVESERRNAFDPAAQGLLEECARVLVAFWVYRRKASPGS